MAVFRWLWEDAREFRSEDWVAAGHLLAAVASFAVFVWSAGSPYAIGLMVAVLVSVVVFAYHGSENA